jgi:DNA polymerase III delta prime subunit
MSIESLPIHQDLIQKLTFFNENKKIPHIIFHGPAGSGKSTLVAYFLDLIYKNKENINKYVMQVNCAYGKGIKFIRDELKFFAKTHIFSNKGDIFKSIILYNADKLTIDAQSALRRCIELFSHNTRFFFIVEDKTKLLKPILSRFCELYVPEPIYKKKRIQLYKYNLDKTFGLQKIKSARLTWLKKDITKMFPLPNHDSNHEPNHDSNHEPNFLLDYCIQLYEKGYSGLDILQLLETDQLTLPANVDEEKRLEMLFVFNRVRKEFRNEKMLLYFFLHFMFISSNVDLENISFI